MSMLDQSHLKSFQIECDGIIPALRELRQEALFFQDSLDYSSATFSQKGGKVSHAPFAS